jgi:predicted site-specific integrase-resolvase
MSDTVPQLLTLLAVAKALCVSPHTVRSWVRHGKLKPVRICRRLLFSPDEIARFLAAAKAAPSGDPAQSQGCEM